MTELEIILQNMREAKEGWCAISRQVLPLDKSGPFALVDSNIHTLGDYKGPDGDKLPSAAIYITPSRAVYEETIEKNMPSPRHGPGLPGTMGWLPVTFGEDGYTAFDPQILARFNKEDMACLAVNARHHFGSLKVANPNPLAVA